MKRFLTILLTTLALTGLLCVTASASSFDNAAEELATIGMLKGGADGFALDTVPTRGQAAIMLVRLYGAEQRAQDTYRSGRITCPFTDVNETTAPYVAWLADEGLANGTSETTFGAGDPCTARAYTIFLLRALGYQDKEDFTTAGAQNFAAELGLVDTSALHGGNFLRDDLVALTYQALATDMKDGKTYLLDHLIQDCELNVEGGEQLVEKVENYRAVTASGKSLQEGLSAKLSMSMAATVSTVAPGQTQPSGQVEQMEAAVEGEIKMLMKGNPQMALDLTVTADGESENVKMWLQGDWVYAQSGEETFKMEVGQEYADLLEASADKNNSAFSLLFVEDVDKKVSGDEVTYTMELNNGLENMVNGIFAQAFQAAGLSESMMGKMNVQDFTIRYVVKGGTLKSASADAAMSMTISEDETAGTAMLGLIMEMKMDVSASGSAVKISFPDFSGFEEVIGAADGPTAILGTTAA